MQDGQSIERILELAAAKLSIGDTPSAPPMPGHQPTNLSSTAAAAIQAPQVHNNLSFMGGAGRLPPGRMVSSHARQMSLPPGLGFFQPSQNVAASVQAQATQDRLAHVAQQHALALAAGSSGTAPVLDMEKAAQLMLAGRANSHQRTLSAVAASGRHSRKGSRYKPLAEGEFTTDSATGELISTTAVVIKNIPFTVTREELMEVINQLEMPKPFALNYHFDNTGIFRGLAFANFKTSEETDQAVNVLNGHDIGGRKIRVEYKKLPLNSDGTQQAGAAAAPLNATTTTAAPLLGRPRDLSVGAEVDLERHESYNALHDRLLQFRDDRFQSEISFSAALSRDERRIVLLLCDKLNLSFTKDPGSEEESTIRVSKSAARPAVQSSPFASSVVAATGATTDALPMLNLTSSISGQRRAVGHARRLSDSSVRNMRPAVSFDSAQTAAASLFGPGPFIRNVPTFKSPLDATTAVRQPKGPDGSLGFGGATTVARRTLGAPGSNNSASSVVSNASGKQVHFGVPDQVQESDEVDAAFMPVFSEGSDNHGANA